MDEFSKGAAHGRDNIICLIMGIQNNMVDMKSPEYRELQKLLEEIIDRYGDLFAPYKG